VANPGVQQIAPGARLLDILTAAGGLRSDAGPVAKIMRPLANGALPIRGASADPKGEHSVGEVNLRALLASDGNAENLLIKPHDVVSVPQANLVYVAGDVVRPGSYPVNDGQALSALQALSLSGGLNRTAAAGQARILRPLMGGPKRAEIRIDLGRIVAGKISDVPLLPNDILFVPSSGARRFTGRAVEALVQGGTLALTWGVMR
jgi:polysaccharide export outer membrane protein